MPRKFEEIARVSSGTEHATRWFEHCELGRRFVAFSDMTREHSETSPDDREHLRYMGQAFAMAEEAYRQEEVPVGAVIVAEGQIIAAAHNQREALRDPTAHAEMIAITQAAESLGSWRLTDCTLYVTLEPCPMCAGAVFQARIPRLVFGALDPKAGAVESLYHVLSDQRLNHQTAILSGVMAEPCGELLSKFFRERRK